MRIKLSEKYLTEREEICNKIISILGLKEDNTFLLCELDEDIEKQNKIMGLKEEIQKYFACSTISSFKPNFECKRPYLNIIRSILRKQNYNFVGNDYTIKINNIPKKTIKYIIFRNN
jgi:hypothetical protein